MGQSNDEEGIDLSRALDNSAGRVTFDREEFQRPMQSFQTETPRIVQWVIKYSGGYIKDERQAQYLLVGLVVVAIVVVPLLLFRGGGNKTELKAPPGQKIIYPENAPPRLEERF